MPQRRNFSTQYISIPSTWGVPKYSIGQCLRIRVLHDDGYEMEPCIVVGVAYRGLNIHPSNQGRNCGWEYTVVLNPDSSSWYLLDEILIAEEDELCPEPTKVLSVPI